MPLSAALKSFGLRLLDAIGAGARFSGGSGAAVALIAADGRLLSLSAPAARMFAAARTATSLSGLFEGEAREAVDRAVRSKALNRLVVAARRPGGALAEIDLVLERRADGRTVVLLLDRTEERRAAERREAEIAEARAQSAGGASMLADLSHEMRTPLNAVIGFAETIEQETFGPVGHRNYAQYAEHIRMAGRHLLDLVNAALDLSKIDADRFQLRRVSADPAAIARECGAIVRHQAEAAGLRLVVDVAEGLSASWLDPRAVKQILINLLSNAIKFTPEGEVSLTARRDGDDLVFAVKDDGVGMNADALSKIGARFTGAQGAGVRGQGGAGLGLSLAISLAELHGGRIDLSSAPGEGLVATVRLPIAEAPEKGAVRAALAAARADDAPSASVTQLDLVKAARRARLKADAA